MSNLLPSARDILASLDLPAIEAAMLTNPDGGELLGFEFEDAKQVVMAAVDKWLVADLQNFSAPSLELEKPFTLKCGGYPVRGVIDLTATYSGGAEKGKRVVADWKTTDGSLDISWQNRLVESFQWRLYSVAESADYISYRGISRPKTNGEGCKTREVYLNVPNLQSLRLTVNTHYCQVGDLMRSQEKYDTWARHMPSACGQYGQTCVFKADCTYDTAPRYFLPVDDIILSYSGCERFLSCPEKYRRVKQAEKGVDGSESTRIGRSAHAGLELIWKSAFENYGEYKYVTY